MANFIARNLPLILGFLGTCVIGFTQQFGYGVGWNGPISFKNRVWRALNIFGWIMLALGFALQIS